MKHKSKEFIINTPSITFWRVVSPRLVRYHLGASDKVEPRSLYWQGDRLLHEDLPLVRQVLHGRRPWWDRQGCFFVDPSWVEPYVDSHKLTLRGLKSPSTWMYDSTTYRNHVSKIFMSPYCVCTLQSHPFTFLQVACFTFRCSYSLAILA